MARNDRRGGNNNPEGRNQYNSGWMDSARERPLAAAAAVGGAVAAGVFLWSRRNQISDQISSLSEQISDWTSSSDSQSGEFEMAGGSTELGAQSGRRPAGMSETGGGNASLGAQTGGKGTGGNR